MYMDTHHQLKQPILTINNNNNSTNNTSFQLLPGFRFHPSDEELIIHYLKNKFLSHPIPASIVADIDLYKHNPWELPMKALFGEDEWYFFSPRDRKYKNGSRPNRAAGSGYWKATGTDKPILTSSGLQSIGVKKALVFYKGRPPKGIKTNWVMHEYRLLDSMIKPSSTPRTSSSSSSSASMRLDDWVLCRVWQKDNSQQRSNLWEGPHYHSMNTNFIEEPFVNNKIIAASTTITANLNYQPAGFDSIFANYLSNDCPVLTSILTNSNSNLHFHSDNAEDMLSDAGSSTSVLFNYPVNKRKSSTMVMNYDYERLLYSLNMKKVNNNISSAIEDHSETADENNQLSPSSNGINRKRGGNANSRNTNSCTYYLEPQYYNIFSNANASS